MILASITEKYRIITSRNVNRDGSNMPLRATSIMPVDVTAPTMIPTDATAMITRTGAALEPMAELRKLAASFITPMKRPVTARSAMAANINVYIGSILSNSGKCGTKIAFSPAGNNSVTYS